MTSAARRRALLEYLELVRDAMRLQAWDLSVSPDPASSPDDVLTITTHELRHSALVRVGSYFEEDRAEQRYAVVHEVVHLIQAPVLEYIDDGMQAPTRAQPPFLAHMKHELELQADQLARLLAPHMPMPPTWPK